MPDLMVGNLTSCQRQANHAKMPPMRLDRYLKRQKISPEVFAEMIGVHPTTIYRFIQGLSFPKSANLRRIAEATKGKVSANDFMGVQRPPAAPGGRGRPRKAELQDEGA
jgi:transcriptional regulator with XRE-family HTH domain